MAIIGVPLCVCVRAENRECRGRELIGSLRQSDSQSDESTLRLHLLAQTFRERRPVFPPMASKRTRGATFMGLPTGRLGHRDLHITRVGFGSWAVGGGG